VPFAVKAIKISDREQAHAFVEHEPYSPEVSTRWCPIIHRWCHSRILDGDLPCRRIGRRGENGYHQAPQISLYLTLTFRHISNKRYTVKPLKQPVIPDVLRN
jgi:hypothetical protein